MFFVLLVRHGISVRILVAAATAYKAVVCTVLLGTRIKFMYYRVADKVTVYPFVYFCTVYLDNASVFFASGRPVCYDK